MELGTSTFADTLEECQSELLEFVEAHIDVLEEIGERDRFFQKWGITLRDTPVPPAHLTIRGSGDSWERLFQNSTDAGAPFLTLRILPVGEREGEAVGAR